jgi:hypothetical protein
MAGVLLSGVAALAKARPSVVMDSGLARFGVVAISSQIRYQRRQPVGPILSEGGRAHVRRDTERESELTNAASRFTGFPSWFVD